MNNPQTLDELLSAKNSGIDMWEAKFIRANVPNEFLHSPITRASRHWLRVNEDVLGKWLMDKGNGPDLANERLQCQAFAEAETFSGNHLHAELMAKLDDRERAALIPTVEDLETGGLNLNRLLEGFNL